MLMPVEVLLAVLTCAYHMLVLKQTLELMRMLVHASFIMSASPDANAIAYAYVHAHAVAISSLGLRRRRQSRTDNFGSQRKWRCAIWVRCLSRLVAISCRSHCLKPL